MSTQITILNNLDLSVKQLRAHGIDCEAVPVAPSRHDAVPLDYIRTTSESEYEFVAFPGDIVSINDGVPKKLPRPVPSMQNAHDTLPEIALYVAQELHETATKIAAECVLLYGIDGQNEHSADWYRNLATLLIDAIADAAVTPAYVNNAHATNIRDDIATLINESDRP